MEYHEAADFLFGLRRFKVDPGTESVRELLSHLGDPHEGIRFVQVAGSNGKGSTARMVESVLRAAGYRVGLYTSPHLDDVRERVRVDGRKMTETALCEFVSAVKPFLVERAAADEPLTFFEVMTAMGLWQFGCADVDVAVLEVGIGGRLDATSVVDPEAAAVTNVTLEHTSVLGDTIAEIAAEKTAVAPESTPLVTGATDDALDAVRDNAGDVVTVDEADDADVTVAYGGRRGHAESAVRLDGPDFAVEARLPLLGAFQARNAGIAATLARQVGGDDVSTTVLERGLRSSHWPGRFEVMERDPMVVLDGAHNPGACEEVAAVLSEFEYDDLHLVFAAMHDKDHRAMVDALPTPDTAVTCRPDVDRAEDPEVLARTFEDAGVAEVSDRYSVAGALSLARSRADADDCVAVVGSLFAVAEARTTWTRTAIPKRTETVDEAREVLEGAHVTGPGVWRMGGKAVHRTLKTRVQRRQAQYLKEEMLSLDGECAVSGVRSDGELVDAVLTGTMAQFKRLVEKLDGQPYGLAGVGEQIRRQLGIGATNGGADASGGDAGTESDATYPWSDGTAVMGILNVTPDSFHDGGQHFAREDAVAQAEAMVEAGVDIVDVGGESTRPGADPVPVEEERDRIVPVIEALSALDVAVSVDTRRAEVGRAALDAGADILNDVSGLEDPEMRFLAAEREVPVVVMHSVEAPVDPDTDAEYDDVVEDVIDQLGERVLLAEKAGVPRERIVVDPGLGFAKSPAENYELLDRIEEFRALGCPILVGHSHKSMFDLVGHDDSTAATVAGTTLAVDRGADVVRVHDVAENEAAVRVVELANRGADDG